MSEDRYEDEAAEEARRGEAARLEEEASAQRFWAGVFADRVGRREMWRFFHEESHAFNAVFPTSPIGFPDPNATFFAAGEQNLGLRLYHRCLRFAQQGVAWMHIEHDPRHAKPEAARRRDTDR